MNITKKRAQILSTLFLFAATTSGTGFFISHKDNTHSVGIAYLVLHGVEFIKLLSRKFRKFSVSTQKNHLLI